MNSDSINDTASTWHFTPAGQPGIPLNSTEIAVRNLAINMLTQYSGHMLGRLANPENQTIARNCSAISAQCTDSLISALDPSARSTAAGNVRDARYSSAERSCGLGVASMCATLDPYNTMAWSMIYQLLPNDQAQILVQTRPGPRAFTRRDAENEMFATVCRMSV